jgi:hypothetical protein
MQHAFLTLILLNPSLIFAAAEDINPHFPAYRSDHPLFQRPSPQKQFPSIRAVTWNRKKLEDFGCFTAEGMEKLRKGGSPMITKGPNTGDFIALDHILPRSVVPELTARFFNLEALSARNNLAKSARIGKRELDLARQWNRAGLLSAPGLKAVELRVE